MTESFFLVGVSAFIIRGNKILLLRRSHDKDYDPGEWEGISGRVEKGETAQEAVVREIAEETGLECKNFQPFDVWKILRGDNKMELIGITFACEYVSGNLILSREHDDHMWMSIDELPHFKASHDMQEAFSKFKSFYDRYK